MFDAREIWLRCFLTIYIRRGSLHRFLLSAALTIEAQIKVEALG